MQIINFTCMEQFIRCRRSRFFLFLLEITKEMQVFDKNKNLFP